VLPLTSAYITTTANVQDNQMYIPLTSSHSSVFSVLSLHYMTGSPGYDAKKLYEYSKSIGNRSDLSSVEIYESNPKKRFELVCFYQSRLGQSIYNQRRISVEPLMEHIKSVFRINSLPARRFLKYPQLYFYRFCFIR
jgi:hypothetical protein